VPYSEACKSIAWNLKGSTYLFLEDELGWASQTVADWTNFLREVYVDWSEKMVKT